ncbi:lipopolysaccharide transport periplasmic protein LptA [Pseudodonghicola flavimaris]|uniref:Lipopolysaccharide transport periplasmic protein LptA n=1 Tax=Pseudodonghicola flavimaris TaxID=3050036 RepID=A0ABT7EX44_9RHOB|nr:lipopolysaccharide transport periplasmic protein LptA [Pseudodonghicola flavimaris]MDK3016918.1 lipopolysaccharide transport periplasmic protein LptA [Pseudodonghicola flavimaris]
MRHLRLLFLTVTLLFGAGALAAQEVPVAFGKSRTDSSAPVEVTADNLDVNQADGSAEFTGDVLVVQGAMRMTANRVFVVYDRAQSRIERLEATGDVLLVSGDDAAEAERADYSIDSGTIVMTGNVLLSQGPSVLSSQKMTVDLDSGTARMAGRVKTILNQDSDDE